MNDPWNSNEVASSTATYRSGVGRLNHEIWEVKGSSLTINNVNLLLLHFYLTYLNYKLYLLSQFKI